MRPTSLRVTTLTALSLSAAACNGDLGPAGSSTLNFQVASQVGGASSGRGAAGPGFDAAATPISLTANGHTLVIADVELVLKRITFLRADHASACPDGDHDAEHRGLGANATGSTSDTAEHGDEGMEPESVMHVDTPDNDDADHRDACAPAAIGPLLVSLPLGATSAQQFSVQVRPGTYTAVSYHVHKVTPEEETFLAAHPDFAGKSIRVTGTFDAAPFTYTTSLNAHQRDKLDPPLTVDQSGIANVTLIVDVSSWFSDGMGGLIDPTTAGPGGVNERLVWRNILRSFRVRHDPD